MIYALAILAVLNLASGRLFTENAESQKYMWEEFKQAHLRDYSTMEEELSRFGHFLDNLKSADLRNEEERMNNGTATHGVTRFSDLSQEEFNMLYLSAIVDKSDAVLASVAPYDGAASLVDWTGTYTTPVKNQAQCGSCWAFSATEQIESDTMRTQNKTFILSPQQVTSCTPFPSMGCNGGTTESAYKYVMKVGGIEQDSDYPYRSQLGKTGACDDESSKFVTTVTKVYTLTGETNMANYMKSTGPLSVCLDASSWNTYTGGIMSVCGKSVDHCVQAVGVDTSTGGYWKVRNSWGSSWGESGFIRLAYGQNTCDITSDPTYVDVKLV